MNVATWEKIIERGTSGDQVIDMFHDLERYEKALIDIQKYTSGDSNPYIAYVHRICDAALNGKKC